MVDKKPREEKKKMEQVKEMTENITYEHSLQAICRTKKKLKKLIRANVDQYEGKNKFITLTFKDYKTRDEIIYCFKQFNKRLRYNYPTCDFQYIAIISRTLQEKLYLQVLYFDLPLIQTKRLIDLWKCGVYYLEESNMDYNISNYMLRNIEDLLKDDRHIPKGAKFYLLSRGLKKPV